MRSRVYHYMRARVYCPTERGNLIEPVPLPSWLHVTITEDPEQGSKWITVHSQIHVNKAVRLSPDYSTEFPDRVLLLDLYPEVLRRWIA